MDKTLDKFILIAIYNGIAGKSKMLELFNLKKKAVDFKNHVIKLDDRKVPMDKDFEEIARQTVEWVIIWYIKELQLQIQEITDCLTMESQY